MITAGFRRLLKYALTLVVFLLTSCGRAPSFDVWALLPSLACVPGAGPAAHGGCPRLLSRLHIVIALPS